MTWVPSGARLELGRRVFGQAIEQAPQRLFSARGGAPRRWTARNANEPAIELDPRHAAKRALRRPFRIEPTDAAEAAEPAKVDRQHAARRIGAGSEQACEGPRGGSRQRVADRR